MATQTTSSTAELKTLIRKRGNVQGAITSFIRKLDAYEAATRSERDPFELQAALDGLRARFEKFSDIQDAIEEIDETEVDKRLIFDDSFDRAIGRSLRLLSSNNAPNSSSLRSTSPEIPAIVPVKLPQMDIPKFDGSIENWHTFFDLFSCLIDKNDSLSPVQKLQYLRNSLTGKAAVAIDSLPTTDKNYDSAIEILKGKFDCIQKTLRRHWTLMREYPRLQRDTPAALGDLVDTVTQHVRALQNLGQPTESWDLPLIDLILSKISPDTAWHWELTLSKSALPKYTNLLEFLEKRANCSDATSTRVTPTKRHQHEDTRQTKHGNRSPRQSFVTISASPCIICSKTSHTIMKCPKFLAMSQAERQNAVRTASLCYNCLKSNHQVLQCPSRNCSLCKKRHHTLLHRPDSSGQTPRSPSPTSQSWRAQPGPSSKRPGHTSLIVNSATSELLVTALLNVVNAKSQLVTCRALLDTGSTTNFITESMVTLLGLRKRNCAIPVGALNAMTTIAKYLVTVTIRSRHNNFERTLEFLVVPQISQAVPDQQINRDAMKIPQNLKLADPSFHRPGPVDLLLGSGTALSTLCVGKIELSARGEPDLFLQKTLFGWVIGGSVPSAQPPRQRRCYATTNEYFKAQIKPQQAKLKKISTNMSLLVAKSSPEFRRPPTVQRNKGGLAKYPGVVVPNGRTTHEREVRTMTIAPRANAGKMNKKLRSKVLPGLPIPSEVLASIPGCKISSLRLTGEASPKPSGVSPPITPTATLMGEPITIDFEDDSPVSKPTVNENNNLTNGQEHPLTRLASGLLDIQEKNAKLREAFGISEFSVERSSPDHWRHVRTHENPADLISRGQRPDEFIKPSIWQHGPSRLQERETTWPMLDLTFPDAPLEKRNDQQAAGIRLPSLAKLSPFLDKKGLLRVGGRLQNAAIPYSQRHPIILPKNHHITRLIIEREHRHQLHAGTQATLYALRQRYWPLNGRNAVRKITKACIQCFVQKPPPVDYVMGNLPEARVTESRPFTNVGIDYCGPFFIKEKRHRNKTRIKVYVAVFICLAVKAVHLEVVSDLSTEAFIAALDRFIGRRGICSHIYSDNGTNFVGAKNEMKEVYQLLQSEDHREKVRRFAANHTIEWHFIPPQSPHFGGLWEAAVKSFKHHLRRVVGTEMLTYEAFNTLVIQIEAVLNSRPLTSLSSDSNDLLVLTPGHFLIGEALSCRPELDFRETPTNRLSMWQHIQGLKQHFWTRWHREYLNELNQRTKWTQGAHCIKEGTVVLLKEDHLPPLQWAMGRVTKVHPGVDGIIRAVTVKTAKGTFDRNVKKLAPLPIHEDQQPENRNSATATSS